MEYSVLFKVAGIVFVDLLLSGDNAILIALASRNLPCSQQRRAICWGTAGAVVLRIVFAFVASLLIHIPLVKAAGGMALFYIAVKLLAEDDGKNKKQPKAAKNFKSAVGTIIIADGIMSLDNVLAVVALADGHIGLVIFGIIVSIPFVMLSSQWLLKIINRFPVVVYCGAAVLGYAAAAMITSDLWLEEYFAGFKTAVNIVLMIAAVVTGIVAKSSSRKKQANRNQSSDNK